MGLTISPKAGIIILPFLFDKDQKVATGVYTKVPNDVFHIYNTLKKAAIPVEVLNLQYQFHDKNVSFDELTKLVSDYLAVKNFTHVILPISVSENICEFFNIDVDLLEKLLNDTTLFKDVNLILTGRVLNENKLKETIKTDFKLFTLSYDEGYEIAKEISNNQNLALRPLEYSREVDDYFHFDHVFALRDPAGEHAVIIVGQRGCLYKCAFCERNIVWPERKVHQLDMDDAIATIEYFTSNYKRKHFAFLDPLFNYSREYVHELCNRIKKYNITWHCEVKVELFDREDLYVMKEAGCTEVLFGVESFDRDTLKGINKSLNFDKLLEVIEICKELGINYILSLVAGINPTLKDAYKQTYITADFILKNNIDRSHVICIPFFLYEGSKFYATEFGTDNYHIFPKVYHPYKIIYMIDIVNLLHNKLFDVYVEIDGEKFYCYRELFEYIQKTSQYDILNRSMLEYISNFRPIPSYLLSLKREELINYIAKFLKDYEDNVKAAPVDPVKDSLEFDIPDVPELKAMVGFISTMIRIGMHYN